MTLDIALGTFSVTEAVVVRAGADLAAGDRAADQRYEPGFANNNEDTGDEPVD